MECSDQKLHWNASLVTPEAKRFLGEDPQPPLKEDVSFGIHLTNTFRLFSHRPGRPLYNGAVSSVGIYNRTLLIFYLFRIRPDFYGCIDFFLTCNKHFYRFLFGPPVPKNL